MNIRDDFIIKDINEGYLVGGMIRDFFIAELNKQDFYTHDRDIAIKGAEEFAKKIADKFFATFITLDELNKIYRIVLPDKENYLRLELNEFFRAHRHVELELERLRKEENSSITSSDGN